jgi:hypothetical protein
MVGLIRSELSAFMNKHRLTAYLASIGVTELEKINQREERLFEDVQKIIGEVPIVLAAMTIADAKPKCFMDRSSWAHERGARWAGRQSCPQMVEVA